MSSPPQLNIMDWWTSTIWSDFDERWKSSPIWVYSLQIAAIKSASLMNMDRRSEEVKTWECLYRPNKSLSQIVMITVFVLGQAPTYTGNTKNRTQWNSIRYKNTNFLNLKQSSLKNLNEIPVIPEAITFVSVNLLCVHNELGQACYANFKGFFANDYTNSWGLSKLPRGGLFLGLVICEPLNLANRLWPPTEKGHGLNHLEWVPVLPFVSKKLVGSTSASHHSWQLCTPACPGWRCLKTQDSAGHPLTSVEIQPGRWDWSR